MIMLINCCKIEKSSILNFQRFKINPFNLGKCVIKVRGDYVTLLDFYLKFLINLYGAINL